MGRRALENMPTPPNSKCLQMLFMTVMVTSQEDTTFQQGKLKVQIDVLDVLLYADDMARMPEQRRKSKPYGPSFTFIISKSARKILKQCTSLHLETLQ